MSDAERFRAEVENNIRGLAKDTDVQALSRIWMREITRHKYAYNYTWMGRPIIQFPQDMMAVQEIVWASRPDLIIETGIAHGGSMVYYASLLELLGGDGLVLGIDMDIRAHNRTAIESHPMAKRIRMIEGSSVDKGVAREVCRMTEGRPRVMVVLDSNHTHEHVLSELRLYSPLVTRGCYLVVFDTLLEDMPDDLIRDRPWCRGNNPKTAVREFLQHTDRFEIDKIIESKLLITVAPDGYLRCIKD